MVVWVGGGRVAWAGVLRFGGLSGGWGKLGGGGGGYGRRGWGGATPFKIFEGIFFNAAAGEDMNITVFCGAHQYPLCGVTATADL